MLPVKKLDTERDATNASAAGGFGKVLGSIQGLQQRLSDFSYGEVSIAEAKVKMLVKQLALLRDSLNNLVQLKFAFTEIDRRIGETPVASFDQVTPDSLEKHPQLHAILQASKLVRAQRPMQGDLAGAEVTPLKLVSANPTDHSLAAKVAEARTTVERARPIDKKHSAETVAITSDTTGDAWVTDRRRLSSFTTAARANESASPEVEPPSFTIPIEPIVAFQDDQVGGQHQDWSFDLHDSTLASSETFTAPINFEFPAENLANEEPVAKNFSKPKLARAKPPTSATVTPTPRHQPSAIEAKAAAAPRVVPAQPAPEKAAVRLDESKALVLANHDFDQRLMEDVIKNYGDFAVTPNLPATRDTSTKIAAVTEDAAKRATAELAKSAAAERNHLNVQKSGDLDRQLKKIIKDYGAYDIYERKSVVTFKTGGIVAFAMLGLVLAILYLFKAPGAVSTPQARSVTQPRVAEPSSSPQAVKSSGDDEHRIGPDAANAGSTPLTDAKQKP